MKMVPSRLVNIPSHDSSTFPTFLDAYRLAKSILVDSTKNLLFLKLQYSSDVSEKKTGKYMK